jgi:hypothetical protein
MEEDNAFEVVMKAAAERMDPGRAALQDTVERGLAIQSALMKTAFETFGLAEDLLARDVARPAEVGAAVLGARSAIYGAFLRLKIQAASLADPAAALAAAEELLTRALEQEEVLLRKVREMTGAGS